MKLYDMFRYILLLITFLISSAAGFDHRYPAYRAFLSAYVTHGGVNYRRLALDTNTLLSAEREFETVDAPRFSRFSEKEQIAYLVNAYNFYTILLIIRHYPLETGIRDIDEPWKRKFIPLFGERVSLDFMEHTLLRKKYSEPRIHMALVCASRSCPELLNEPYTAGQLESQLEQAGKKFLQDSTKNRVEGTTIFLSRIFKWYGDDFNKINKDGYRGYVGSVLGISPDAYTIRFLPYDWSLNSTE